MKTLSILMILSLITFDCSNKNMLKEDSVIQSKPKSEKVFKQVADFPIIKDSTQFIIDLKQIFDLQIHESPSQKKNQKITIFKKVKLYGSEKDYYFIEYDWNIGAMSEYTWKYQLLLIKEGKLIKKLSSERFEFVEIFKNQNPFLLVTNVTSKGNGGHEIYKVSADTLENIYEGYYDYAVQTISKGYKLYSFEPNELKIDFIDINKDGFNDLVFTGKKMMLGKYTEDGFWYDVEDGKPFTVQNPSEIVPIKYVFLYDKETEHFKAVENQY